MTTDAEDFGKLLADSEKEQGLERGRALSGTVMALEAQGLIVDLGQKRDGVVPQAEVEKLQAQGMAFKVGDTVKVVVANPHDKDGNLVVSIEYDPHATDWQKAEELLANGQMWEGKVVGFNKGGLLVQFDNVRAFVPASHVSDLPHNLHDDKQRMDLMRQLVGQTTGFKVVEVDRKRQRLVLSQRNAQKEYRKQQKAKLLGNLTEGQVLTGVVTGLRDFGVFVNLGGADGLIHISELSWHRVKHPREILAIGQSVEVEVLKIDPDGKRIALSLKRRQVDPWVTAKERFQIGQEVTGKVMRVTTFGAFVNVEAGLDGLIHTSRYGGFPVPAEGDLVRVKVMSVDPDKQRIALTLVAPSTRPEATTPPDEHDADPAPAGDA